MMNYPNKLRAARKLNGLNEEQVASYLGLKNDAIITRWENGEILPSTPQLLMLAAIYNISAIDLYPQLYKKLDKEMTARIKQLGLSKKKKPK